MGMTRDDRELLGAYALDALDDHEVAAVEALLERDPDAQREVARLREAASWIAATEALAPPRDLRAQLFERAHAVPPELRLYRQAVSHHERLLDSLPADSLHSQTSNGLNVGELVVHLAAQESAMAEAVGLPCEVTAETHIETRTGRYVEAYGEDPLGAGRMIWRTAADALDAWAASDADANLAWNGSPMPRRTALAIRAFELWTHDDDIRVALGRDVEAPSESELAVMSDVAVGFLPGCLATRGVEARGAARVVLTGGGGGDWMVSLDGREHVMPEVTLTMDVVAYCRLVADRVTPADCGAIVEGDVEFGRQILECAGALATL